MVIHSDQRYIEALLQNDKQVVEEVYQRFAPAIRSHILKNRGSEDDAADIFQESLIDIYKQATHLAFGGVHPGSAPRIFDTQIADIQHLTSGS